MVDLIEHNETTAAVNQIETHPFFQHTDYQRLMQQGGVQIESWGPLAEGKNDILINPTLVAIADAHGRSVAQVVLRSACSTCACAAARPSHASSAATTSSSIRSS